jgi:hypothetical protein
MKLEHMRRHHQKLVLLDKLMCLSQEACSDDMDGGELLSKLDVIIQEQLDTQKSREELRDEQDVALAKYSEAKKESTETFERFGVTHMYHVEKIRGSMWGEILKWYDCEIAGAEIIAYDVLQQEKGE